MDARHHVHFLKTLLAALVARLENLNAAASLILGDMASMVSRTKDLRRRFMVNANRS